MQKLGLALTALFLLVAGVGTYLALRPSEEPAPTVDEDGPVAGDGGRRGGAGAAGGGRARNGPRGAEGLLHLGREGARPRGRPRGRGARDGEADRSRVRRGGPFVVAAVLRRDGGPQAPRGPGDAGRGGAEGGRGGVVGRGRRVLADGEGARRLHPARGSRGAEGGLAGRRSSCWPASPPTGSGCACPPASRSRGASWTRPIVPWPEPS